MKVKTEHSGSKKGRGAWHGVKAEAKAVSRKARRQIDRKIVRDAKVSR